MQHECTDNLVFDLQFNFIPLSLITNSISFLISNGKLQSRFFQIKTFPSNIFIRYYIFRVLSILNMKLLNSKLLEESKYYKFLELPNKTSLNIYNKNLNFRYIHLTILQELKCLTHTHAHTSDCFYII